MKKIRAIIARFNLGRARIWMGRFQSYLNLIQFGMVAWLALQGHMNIYLILAAMIGACTLMYFDITHIYPKEASYAFTKTPEWVQMSQDIRDVKGMLREFNLEKREGQ